MSAYEFLYIKKTVNVNVFVLYIDEYFETPPAGKL